MESGRHILGRRIELVGEGDGRRVSDGNGRAARQAGGRRNVQHVDGLSPSVVEIHVIRYQLNRNRYIGGIDVAIRVIMGQNTACGKRQQIRRVRPISAARRGPRRTCNVLHVGVAAAGHEVGVVGGVIPIDNEPGRRVVSRRKRGRRRQGQRVRRTLGCGRIAGHAYRGRIDREVGPRIGQAVVAARCERALVDGVGAHVLAGCAGQDAAEAVVADQVAAGHLVGKRRVGSAIDFGLAAVCRDRDWPGCDGEVGAVVGDVVVAQHTGRAERGANRVRAAKHGFARYALVRCRDVVARQKPARGAGQSRIAISVNLAGRGRSHRRRLGRDRAGRGRRAHKVIFAAVAVVDRIACDVKRAQSRAQHVLRSERLRRRYRVVPQSVPTAGLAAEVVVPS